MFKSNGSYLIIWLKDWGNIEELQIDISFCVMTPFIESSRQIPLSHIGGMSVSELLPFLNVES